MDTHQLLELLDIGPVIAAVKDPDGLAQALDSDVSVLFLLYGDILTIRDTVARVREAGKRVFVHLDLIEGLSPREISADFIARSTAADGVISTKPALTRRARELGLVAIQRIFLLDSVALKNVERHFSQESADLVEVLPGLMPKIIRQLCRTTGRPIIAGGLITDKEDVTGALGAGAVAVLSGPGGDGGAQRRGPPFGDRRHRSLPHGERLAGRDQPGGSGGPVRGQRRRAGRPGRP